MVRLEPAFCSVSSMLCSTLVVWLLMSPSATIVPAT